MLLVLVILAISFGLTYACNSAFFKQRSCPTGPAILLAGVIGILSLVGGLLLLVEVFNLEVSPKVMGPALAIGVFGSWGLLNRRKKGADSQPETTPEKGAVAPASEQEQPGTAKVGTPDGISKRIRMTTLLGGGLGLVSAFYSSFTWMAGRGEFDFEVEWERLGFLMIVSAILTALAFVFMKDEKWPLK